MKRLFLTKQCIILTVCLFLVACLFWYSSAAWWSSGKRSSHHKNSYYLSKSSWKKQKESKNILDNDLSRFSYQNFIKRRQEKIAKLKSKRTRRGKILEYKPSKVVMKTSCVPFKTMVNNTRLCVHSKLYDPLISSHIRDNGSWEPDCVAVMATALSTDPDMHLLDIGCNLGMYTMYAALMGRNVVAVDPIRSNLFMLHSSLVYAGLRDSVTLLLNAVSDYAEPVKVLINPENVGGSRVEPITDTKTKDDVTVDAIVLDDLVRVLDFKKMFIKMDIEGYEVNAIRRSSRFFKKFDVRYIMMEWMFQRNNQHGQEIIDILTYRGFRPCADMKPDVYLDTESYSTWPDNVIWYKKLH